MKKYGKGLLFVLGAIALGVIGLVLQNTDYAGYSILCYTGTIVLLILGISALINSSSPTRMYESKIRNILNTYDSILVQSNQIPSLEGRNIVNLEQMDDLVDAQLELRKPICFLKQTESCSFILLDEKEAYIYVEKLNDSVVSPVEIELNELKLKEKDRDDMDSEMLRGIDKTTIVKLSNKKSYKVSPVRKKSEGEIKETITMPAIPVVEAAKEKMAASEEVPATEEVSESIVPTAEEKASVEEIKEEQVLSTMEFPKLIFEDENVKNNLEEESNTEILEDADVI